jgi:ribosomal protein S18 acetylase RimI-like enzyme
MDFRKAVPSDLPLLARWNYQLIRDEGHRNPMGIPQLRRRMAGWIRKEYKVLLFEQDQILAGYVLYRKEKGHVYLRQFFVDRKFRRKGWGRKAMKILLTKVWPQDRPVRLEVLVQNKRARAFWAAVGFKDYCLTMEKR